MNYPRTTSDCQKLLDHPNQASDDGSLVLEYKGLGRCSSCPLQQDCSGPELFGLHVATFELRNLQQDLHTMSLLADYPRRASGG